MFLVESFASVSQLRAAHLRGQTAGDEAEDHTDAGPQRASICSGGKVTNETADEHANQHCDAVAFDEIERGFVGAHAGLSSIKTLDAEQHDEETSALFAAGDFGTTVADLDGGGLVE